MRQPATFSLPPIVRGSRFVIGVALREDERWYAYIDNYVPALSAGEPALAFKIYGPQGFATREQAAAFLPLLKKKLQMTLRQMGFDAMAREVV